MKRKIISTSDGSSTIYLPDWDEHYHSKHGAIQEAKHVFINKALEFFIAENNPSEISILEIGFGTGLNAFLTLLYAEKHQINIKYTAVEAFPVKGDELEQLNYVSQLNADEKKSLFKELHSCEWNVSRSITPYFSIKKQQKEFSEISDESVFNIVYFDAFGPRVQPELWTTKIFKLMYNALISKGVLTTYCAQGAARRNMIESGFDIEKLEGPPGKREMLRALKL